MRTPLLFIAIFLLFCYSGKSQTIQQKLISPSQKTTVTEEFSYSWSIGETIVISSNSTINAGYHSIASIPTSTLTTNKLANIQLPVTAYPNPTKRFLNVDLSQLNEASYNIIIYDLKGLKQTPPIQTLNYMKIIDLNSMGTGIYYVKVIEKHTGNTIKQLKIIKK